MDTAEKIASIFAGLEGLGLTPSEISRGAHISRTTLWRLRVGEYSSPSYATITRLEAFERRIAPVPDMKHR